VIVEWAEKFALRTEWPVVRIHLEHVAEETRRIWIEGAESGGVGGG
jgi:tRNA A37 threonylcarbamoyladenosine biosynthesis protein TsaE